MSGTLTVADQPRVYRWVLSKDSWVELRIVTDGLAKAQANRLRHYINLTLAALLGEESANGRNLDTTGRGDGHYLAAGPSEA